MAQKTISLKMGNLFWLLSIFVIGNAMIAELLGMKIFSMGKLLHMAPISISWPFPITIDFNMSVGILIWPFVFIISDLINEYFGRSGVRKISIFTAIIILFGFIFIYLGTSLPGADFWINLNSHDPKGNPFDVNFAYQTVFRQSAGIIVGSISAFLLSQLIDAYTFYILKNRTGHRMLWLRATGSTVVSQLIDSFVILFIAFYLLGNWNIGQVLTVGVVQYFYKIFLAIVLTPLIYLAHKYIDLYLGDEHPENNLISIQEEPSAD
jgi:queuosine precursor transporter